MLRSISPSTHVRAVVAAIVVTVLWSSSWVIIRTGLDDEALPPITFAALRYALAAVVLGAWVATSSRTRHAVRSLDRNDRHRIAVLGLGFYAVTQGAQFVAIDSQPAATTSMLLSLSPLVVGVVGSRSLDERTAGRQYVGAVLVAVGALLFFAGDLGATVVGVAAAVVGLIANSTSALLGRDVNRGHQVPAVVVTAMSMAVGAAVLLVAALLIDGWPRVSLAAALMIGWLAVVNTACAFTLWNWSLRHLTAVESTGLNNTMLVQIALLAWVFLDESPGLSGLAGVLVVTLGVFLTSTRRSPSDALVSGAFDPDPSD